MSCVLWYTYIVRQDEKWANYTVAVWLFWNYCRRVHLQSCLSCKPRNLNKVVIPALVYYYDYSLTFIMILRGEPHTGAARMNVKIKCNRTNPSDVSCGLTTSSSSCNNAPFLCRFKDSKLYWALVKLTGSNIFIVLPRHLLLINHLVTIFHCYAYSKNSKNWISFLDQG